MAIVIFCILGFVAEYIVRYILEKNQVLAIILLVIVFLIATITLVLLGE